MDEDTQVVAEYPVLSGVVVFAVAAVAWVGVSLLMRDGVDPVTTVLFAVAFTAVYVGFHRYGS